MRQHNLFGRTLRAAPAAVQSPGAALLERAGFVRGGDWLPLGERVLARLQSRIEQALATAGFQPVRQADPCKLAESEITSWRQLPVFLVQEAIGESAARAAAGALGASRRWQLRLDALLPAESAAPFAGLQADLWEAALLEPLGLVPAETLTGRAWFFLHPLGDETLLRCPACGYTADRAAARRGKPRPPAEPPLALEPVQTPNCHTIAQLCDSLGIPPERTAKAVFLTATIDGNEQLVFAVLRGDMELNEARLAHLLGAAALRPATPEEIRAVGAEPGYASPVGLENVLVVADDLLPHAPNLVAGGNAPDLHLRNVNYGRDFTAARLADLAQAAAGSPCPHCGQPLQEESGFALLRETAPQPLKTAYSAEDGAARPIWHAGMTLELGRIVAAHAERSHDADGLIWPAALAPFDLHLLWLPGRRMDTRSTAEQLYADLTAAGWRVLFDDREERPGVKFKDADLIGLPVRITVGERALEAGAVEVRLRADGERQTWPLEDVLARLVEALGE